MTVVVVLSHEMPSFMSGWCQRIKSDFKFEYSFLEDELSVP